MERTLSIVKPDAVEKNKVGGVLSTIEEAGLKLVATKMVHLSKEQAEGFYAVHSERPFFGELVAFMTRSPVVISVLQGENAIQRHRDVMGATNPADASKGTIRALFGTDVGENACHGSDAPETAREEISYFFNAFELARM
jgi:nucleoside-diphosphate kinase